jgi:multidrug efflux pump subunit AcrB
MEKIIFDILNSKSKKRMVIAIVLAALMGSVLMIPTKLVLAKMLPGKSANTFTIYVDTPTNSSISQTKSVTECIVNFLKQEKEITDMETYLGQGAPLDYAGLVKGSALKSMKNQAEIVVNLTDKHHRDEASYMMIHRMRPELKKTCGNVIEGTTIKFVEMPSGPPTLATIVVELFGKEKRLVRQTAERVANVLERTEGLVDIDVMQDTLFTKYELVPDKEKIIRSALSVQQVNQIIYLAFQGQKIAVKNTRNQQDQIPIFVRLTNDSRTIQTRSKESLINKLSSLKLMNQSGTMIPLSELVNIEPITSSPTIFRKNLKNMATITAECDMVSQVYPLL